MGNFVPNVFITFKIIKILHYFTSREREKTYFIYVYFSHRYFVVYSLCYLKTLQLVASKI